MTEKCSDGEVQAFIGSPEYYAHKDRRFPQADNQVIEDNPAFSLTDPVIRRRFEAAYRQTAALYYRGQIPFEEILERIQEYSARL